MADVTNVLGTRLLDDIQFGFIGQINQQLSTLQNSALALLAIVAGLELVIFGLVWIIKHDEGVGNLIVKIIKIGFFFTIVKYFPELLNMILVTFLKVGYIIAPEKSQALLYSPGKVWVIGFKAGVSTMKISVEYGTFNVGLSMLYLILGMGLLLIFAAIGAQIIISVVLFYFVAVLSLIVVPLGVFKPTQDLFYKAIQHLLRTGVRLLAVIFILGVAFTLFQSLKITSISDSTSLEKPLALFFTSFILLILIYTLPSYLARAVGKPGGNIFQNMMAPATANVVVSPSMQSTHVSVSPVGAAASMHGVAGSSVAMGGAVQSGATIVSGGSYAGSGNTNVNVSTTVQGASLNSRKQDKVAEASTVNKSISDSTIRKIKED
ncbi:type IV secretion system protein [Fastidiosibacter lacustris]|uniref:type IV secretion system protein n=1 Tax=Fastidiosibacter lacustris TaxID=2056695 RepID=UPI000E341989|nr:type IV secretion system protein [Fastidiosibacter lacustris]